MTLRELAKAGEWSEALASFQDWLNEADAADLLLARALCRCALGDVSGAIVDCCAALEEPHTPQQGDLTVQISFDAPQAARTLLEAAEGFFDAERLLALRDRLQIPDQADEIAPPGLSLSERRALVEGQCAQFVESGEWGRGEAIAEQFLGEVSLVTPDGETDAKELQATREAAEALVTQLLADHAVALLGQGATATATLLAKRAAATLGPYHRGEQILDVRIVAAQAAIALGEPQEALDDLSDAERYVRNRMQRARVGELLADVGDLAHLQKRLDVAASAYDRAASLFERAKNKDGSSPVLASALRAAARKLRD